MLRPTLGNSLPLVILALLVAAGGAPPAAAQSYADGFENSSFDPFWTVREQFGSVAPSPGLSHGGAQSARFSSASGGQRELRLKHVFPAPVKGSFVVYFYDAAPGQETLYEKLYLYNSATADGASMGTQDFDAHCYTASQYNDNTGVLQGPDAPCGIFPQTSTTNVSRTLGWHRLEINVAADHVSYEIDGTQVLSVPGDYSFDTVELAASGPFWRPNTTAYFDDFSFTPLSPAQDTQPPTITAPPDLTVFTGFGALGCGTFVSDAALGVAAASDDSSGVTVTRSAVPPGNFFPVGVTALTHTATDASGNTQTAVQLVTVVDDTPPAISPVTASPSTLWPPNHKMREVEVSYEEVGNCGTVSCVLSVTSNEPPDGAGNGAPSPDWEIVDARRVRLRAARSGHGRGRAYTVTVTCTDGAGNASSRSATVTVPHDRR